MRKTRDSSVQDTKMMDVKIEKLPVGERVAGYKCNCRCYCCGVSSAFAGDSSEITGASGKSKC